jgi:hypothetical protein
VPEGLGRPPNFTAPLSDNLTVPSVGAMNVWTAPWSAVMQLETKYLRLSTAVTLGSRFGDCAIPSPFPNFQRLHLHCERFGVIHVVVDPEGTIHELMETGEGCVIFGRTLGPQPEVRHGCGTKPKQPQTKLRKREWARIDLRGATTHCINQIQIYEKDTRGRGRQKCVAPFF